LSRLHWSHWNDVSDSLDTGSLVNLVRGLLLTEEALSQWSSGSVAPVIWTFHALQNRSLGDARTVAQWGRERTTNSYVPFSREKTGYWEAKRERTAASAEIQKQQQTEAELRRLERSRLAERHRTVSSSNSRDRTELLQRLADLPLSERLSALVESDHRALSWFPESWATEAISSIRDLAPELKDQLIIRLIGHRKGPWRRLREVLMQTSSI
jgi:hypothetical protein